MGAPRFPLRFFASVLAALLLLTVAWTFATPIYSVPDEASHTVRATAAAHGQLVGPTFDAPRYLYIPGAGSCFAGQPSKTPACVGHGDPGATDLVETPTWAGTNSPVYYVVTGWPSLLFTAEAAIFAMRLVSGAVTALSFAALATLIRLWPGARWSLLLPVATLTPMTFFLAGSVNPNAMEMASAGALFASLITLGRWRPQGWLLWFASLTAVVSVALVTGGRSIGMLWLLLIAVAVALLLRPDDWRAAFGRRSTRVVVALSALITAAQFFWFTRPENEVHSGATPVPGSLYTVAQTTLEGTVANVQGMIGLFGTVDVPAPDLVYALWFALIAALILLPLVLGRGRERWISAAFAAALVLVPVVIQVSLFRQVGYVWQGRYMLAVLLLLGIVAGMALDRAGVGSGSHRTVASLRAIAVVIAAGQFGAFAFTLRRYAVGGTSWVSYLLSPTWQPPGTVLLLTLAAVVSLAFFAVVAWRGLPGLFQTVSRQGAMTPSGDGIAVESGSQRNA